MTTPNMLIIAAKIEIRLTVSRPDKVANAITDNGSNEKMV
jgi:hypothetical protein